MRISDWSSDVCSSDLTLLGFRTARTAALPALGPLHLAMLRAAGLPVPADAAENAKPALLRTIALLPDADPTMPLTPAEERSERRRVGKQFGRTVKSRWAPYPHKKKTPLNHTTT